MINPRIIVGLFLIIFGLSFLLDFPFLSIFLALLVILLGIKVITGSKIGEVGNWGQKSKFSESDIRRVAIFSNINGKVVSDSFTGGEVVAVFGGGELDLSKAKAAGNLVEMNVVAVFGGLKLIVPKDWKISSQGVGILGAFDNKAGSSTGKTTLKVEGVAIFGGVEIVD